MDKTVSGHKWAFQKTGGLYQVVLRDGDDICRLGTLDPKLWVALSCPSSGLEFDQRTLALLDKDNDGRIRLQDVIEALDWLCTCLKEMGSIMDAPQALPLEAIDTSGVNGQILFETAKTVLTRIGKADTGCITQEDAGAAVLHASEQLFNGDGILPPSDGLDDDVNRFIKTALNVIGGVIDASKVPGINKEIAAAFFETLKNRRSWEQSLSSADTPFKENTSEAWQLYSHLKDKIDDYFLRCEFAVFAPKTSAMLNADGQVNTHEKIDLLNAEFMKELPLSRIEADNPLNMARGINPAWQASVARFAELINPVLEIPGIMTRDDWGTVKAGFDGYAKVLSEKPVSVAAKITEAPVASVYDLPADEVPKLIESGAYQKLCKLVDEDLSTPTGMAEIAEVERLVCYYRHFYRFLMNFVTFEDFYSDKKHAAFEVGTLFIDGRACRLCMYADDIEKHAALAQRSYLYLLYCKCSRTKRPGTDEPEGTFNIVAAVTAGDSDLLMVGRNGVYVGKQGYDWDATVIKVISNPIGIRQAVWSPYKRFAAMVGEQINKIAGEKQSALMNSTGQKIQQAAVVSAGTPPPKVDIGRNVGIFAAIGLALGAIGTAFAALARALLSLDWWQLPLVFIVIFIIISGPSVVMAWLKLRQRSLGPLLEASGWAVNGKVAIKAVLGNMLTTKAELPKNAARCSKDIFDKKSYKGIVAFIVAFILGILIVYCWSTYKHKIIQALGNITEEAESIDRDMPASGM